MKKILLSLGTLVAVAAVVAGGTIAFYNDTETSTGNVFTAGSVDLKVDHTYAEYNGEVCNDCVEGDADLIENGGFENPDVSGWDVFDSIPGWVAVAGSGIEIQANGIAGAPYEGTQLVELDSHTPGSSQSSMQQIIDTDPGQKYRLTFYHSPRPNNGPDTDNAIALDVLVTSNSGTLVDETIGQPSSSNSGTVWTEYEYDFVALDTQTTIRFTDDGSQSDTLGGYLDDVSVVTLDCDDEFTYGGTCTLWSETDLSGEGFWNFTDVKPGDYGTSVLSLHVYSNDSFACLFPANIADDENTVVDPELTALPVNDTSDDGIPNGELSGELEFFMWNDADADNQYDAGEAVLIPAGTPFNEIPTEMTELSLTGDAPITLVGINWCAGAQDGPIITGDTDAVTCDGNGMGNIAQTDQMVADFVAYAIQQRNNVGFSCQDVLEDFPTYVK